MRVLALSSSTAHASIALCDGDLSFERHHDSPRAHTEFMNSALDEILRESSLPLEKIDLIAVDQGPGSFTGIRVAVSVARSLCYLLQKPCFMATSLEILQSPLKTPSIAALNAFKNLLYCSIKPRPFENSRSEVLSPTQLQDRIFSLNPETPFLFVGDGWSAYQNEWTPRFQSLIRRDSSQFDFPQALVLARLSQLSSPADWISDWKAISPLYLRASAAEENLRKP